MKRFFDCNDVCEILECKKAHAYEVIKKLNNELEEKGYLTERGKIPSQYFLERFNLTN